MHSLVVHMERKVLQNKYVNTIHAFCPPRNDCYLHSPYETEKNNPQFTFYIYNLFIQSSIREKWDPLILSIFIDKPVKKTEQPIFSLL